MQLQNKFSNVFFQFKFLKYNLLHTNKMQNIQEGDQQIATIFNNNSATTLQQQSKIQTTSTYHLNYLAILFILIIIVLINLNITNLYKIQTLTFNMRKLTSELQRVKLQLKLIRSNQSYHYKLFKIKHQAEILLSNISTPLSKYVLQNNLSPFTTIGHIQYSFPQIINWNPSQFLTLLKPYNDTNCQLKRYGNQHQGGYLLCQNILSLSKVFFSYGSLEQDMFGCELSTKHNISHFKFNCNNQKIKQCQNNNTKYFNSCINFNTYQQRNIKYITIKDSIDANHHRNSNMTIFLYSFGNQWQSLRSLPLQYIKNIHQIVIVLHNIENNYQDYLILDRLLQYFVIVNFHNNNFGCKNTSILRSNINQLTLVNKELIKLHNQSRSYKQHPQNALNCQNCTQICSIQQKG